MLQESDDAAGSDEASKRSIQWLMQWLEQTFDAKKVVRGAISDIISYILIRLIYMSPGI